MKYNEDLLGKLMTHDNGIFEIFEPIGSGIREWKIRNVNNHNSIFAVNVNYARVMIENFELMSSDNSKPKTNSLMERLKKAIILRNEQNTNNLVLDLTDDELKFIMLWIATGFKQEELLKNNINMDGE